MVGRAGHGNGHAKQCLRTVSNVASTVLLQKQTDPPLRPTANFYSRHFGIVAKAPHTRLYTNNLSGGAACQAARLGSGWDVAMIGASHDRVPDCQRGLSKSVPGKPARLSRAPPRPNARKSAVDKRPYGPSGRS